MPIDVLFDLAYKYFGFFQQLDLFCIKKISNSKFHIMRSGLKLPFLEIVKQKKFLIIESDYMDAFNSVCYSLEDIDLALRQNFKIYELKNYITIDLAFKCKLL